MIEIKNIVKTYRPKKGGEVKALDDVSLKFPEKGLGEDLVNEIFSKFCMGK